MDAWGSCRCGDTERRVLGVTACPRVTGGMPMCFRCSLLAKGGLQVSAPKKTPGVRPMRGRGDVGNRRRVCGGLGSLGRFGGGSRGGGLQGGVCGGDGGSTASVGSISAYDVVMARQHCLACSTWEHVRCAAQGSPCGGCDEDGLLSSRVAHAHMGGSCGYSVPAPSG